MVKIVECVPNFSEGRDPVKIKAISDAIDAVDNVKLLDVDPGKDTNRTVITFVGDPEHVLEAAFQGIKAASEVIDMQNQTGAHARMGATDVCPFVPVSGMTMDECSDLARRLGKRVGDELGIPVFLYEAAASVPERENLADIRAGEYEGLEQKLKDPQWKPDFGPAEFNARSGATVIGAREFLIAYNINLNTRNTQIAKEIAFTIREKGRLKRDNNRKIVRDENGTALRVPGKFTNCKAVGWYMEDFGRAQVSMNLTNYKITPPNVVFDECCRLAESMGARVTGSELVGLIPLDALKNAGTYYLQKQGKPTGVPESELIHIAVLSMGLGDLYTFEKEKKVIEYQLERHDELTGMRVDEFADVLSTDAPAPGGGSVASLCGALSSALSAMVAALTFDKKGYESVRDDMDALGPEAQALKMEFIRDVDRDTEAFNSIMDAMRLPKKTDGEKARRNEAIMEATKGATMVPFDVLTRSKRAAELAHKVAENGNKNSVSDAGVAALCARTAAEGAYLNVIINLTGIDDEAFCKTTREKALALRDEVIQTAGKTAALTEKIISNE